MATILRIGDMLLTHKPCMMGLMVGLMAGLAVGLTVGRTVGEIGGAWRT